MFSLANKVALVTGGASGIGLAIATRFVRAGAHVVILDRSEATLIAEGIGATYHHVDVTDEKTVKAACDAVAQRFGLVDIMVNNAGVFSEGTIAEASTDEWNRCFQINTLGVLFGIRHVAPHMRAGGSIINTASVAALLASPGYGAYAASKSGAAVLTQVAALEYGPRGIRVNCICPASVDTPMLSSQDNADDEAAFVSVASPLGRITQPEEIAALAHFLASDDASAITGTVIPIDAGVMSGISSALSEAAVESAGPAPTGAAGGAPHWVTAQRRADVASH